MCLVGRVCLYVSAPVCASVYVYCVCLRECVREFVRSCWSV